MERRMVCVMKENYKEMYIHLYKHLAILECILQRLANRVSDSITESTGIYLDHFDKQMQDKEDIKKRFADLLEGL